MTTMAEQEDRTSIVSLKFDKPAPPNGHQRSHSGSPGLRNKTPPQQLPVATTPISSPKPFRKAPSSPRSRSPARTRSSTSVGKGVTRVGFISPELNGDNGNLEVSPLAGTRGRSNSFCGSSSSTQLRVKLPPLSPMAGKKGGSAITPMQRPGGALVSPRSLLSPRIQARVKLDESETSKNRKTELKGFNFHFSLIAQAQEENHNETADVQTVLRQKAQAQRKSSKPLTPGGTPRGIFQAPLCLRKGSFLLETGSSEVSDISSISLNLIDKDRYTQYYRHYFYQQDHKIYLGYDTNGHPLFVCLENASELARQEKLVLHLRALVLTCHPWDHSSESNHWALIPHDKKNSDTKLLAEALPEILGDIKLTVVKDTAVSEELLDLEDLQTAQNYKFGVCLCREGQVTEEEMLSNSEVTDDFREFLDMMGSGVKLQGWDHFNGGLDVKTNATGANSYYTTCEHYEVMFHVAPLMPSEKWDEQSLARKRFIGNDVVVIVFKEDASPLDPTVFRSQMNHVFIVIMKEKKVEKDDPTMYRISIASKGGVHAYEPLLPFPSTFEKSHRLQKFLLIKMINSERATMYAPAFVTKLTDSRTQLIRLIDERLKKRAKRGFDNKPTQIRGSSASSSVVRKVESTTQVQRDELRSESVALRSELRSLRTEKDLLQQKHDDTVMKYEALRAYLLRYGKQPDQIIKQELAT
eukprot:TRINITY_DN6946_c0_g1_i1.p1 TRINITY_DN6946_c0_g1~~TRINITY_DN6946_c0_g1_i1.p1  ORF type:complete len:695 (+),score=138.19 TRINITY_DN6946_c0_g1_i1:242-2326(+)